MNRSIWLDKPHKSNYTAAADYLELHFSEAQSLRIVKRLLKEKVVVKKAKDVLRASRSRLLAKSNVHVRENIAKIKRGQKLSPILVVRGERTIIADGYHRLCAIYYLSEDLDIPCKLTDP
jgi:disulfide oxidoreductase YuzD